MNTTLSHLLIAAAGMVGGFCTVSTAQPLDDVLPIILKTGFEPPAYVTGSLVGQDRWTGQPEFPATNAAQVIKGFGTQGSPAVRISPGTFLRSDCEWSRPTPYQMTTMFPVLRVEWDFFMASTKQPSEIWQTVLRDPKGAVLCGLLITPSGASYIMDGPEPHPILTPVPPDVWNHFEMRLNFSAATADYFINGSPLSPEAVPAPMLHPEGSIGSISYAVINPGFDTVFLDNLSIEPSAFACRANCDGSVVPPVLNVLDFACFQKSFVEALSLPPKLQVTSYANFDQSTTEPVLNVNDYTAFLSAYAAGCR